MTGCPAFDAVVHTLTAAPAGDSWPPSAQEQFEFDLRVVAALRERGLQGGALIDEIADRLCIGPMQARRLAEQHQAESKEP